MGVFSTVEESRFAGGREGGGDLGLLGTTDDNGGAGLVLAGGDGSVGGGGLWNWGREAEAARGLGWGGEPELTASFGTARLGFGGVTSRVLSFSASLLVSLGCGCCVSTAAVVLCFTCGTSTVSCCSFPSPLLVSLDSALSTVVVTDSVLCGACGNSVVSGLSVSSSLLGCDCLLSTAVITDLPLCFGCGASTFSVLTAESGTTTGALSLGCGGLV